MARLRGRSWTGVLSLTFVVIVLFSAVAHASVGDRLPEFRECLKVRDTSVQPLSQLCAWSNMLDSASIVQWLTQEPL